jgi:uncharacterized SAM-binding protein YcdF (DUF218 family)
MVLRLATAPLRWVTAPLRWGFRLLLLFILAIVVYYVATLVQVWLTSREYNPVSAGAIVVMGSAQYDGIPSPDLKARLDQALILYQQGYAHTIVCTGYKERGDQYTEAQAGATYLESKGVPPESLVEAGGRDSWENLSQAAAELKALHATTVLIVTDPYHEDRSMAIATDVGLQPHPAPTQTSPLNGVSVVPYFLKEAVGVAAGRIIGYQAVHNIFG